MGQVGLLLGVPREGNREAQFCWLMNIDQNRGP